MSHGCWNEDIGGVLDGIGIIFSNAPVRNISVTVTSSYFIHTILSRKVDAFRIGCLVTTNLNDKSTHNTSRNILTITDSIIDNYYDTTYVVTSNQYNHSIIHIITSTIMSVNLRIQLNHLECKQGYIGFQNLITLSESTNRHKNFTNYLTISYLISDLSE